MQKAPTNSTLRVAATGKKWHTLMFRDQEGTPFKVRMHPRKLYTATLLAVTEVPASDLFGSTDWSDLDWSHYVFFDGHAPSQMLNCSYLAAAASIDDLDHQVIYGRVSLPTDEPVERHDNSDSTTDAGDVETGFEDLLPPAEEIGDDDEPA